MTAHETLIRAARIEGDLRVLVVQAIANTPVAEVSRMTGAVPRTVKGWRHGEHLPGAAHLIMLARAFPQIREAVTVWLYRDESGLHPHAETQE